MLFRICGYIYLSEIFLCLILSLLLYKRGNRAEQWLPLFFFLLFSMELFAFTYVGHVKSIRMYYNFWFPVELVFYALFINAFIKNKAKTVVIRWGCWIYLVFVMVNYIFFTNLFEFATTVFLTGVLLSFPVLFIKLYEILNGEILANPLKNPLFWFITGLLIANISSFFVMGAINYLLIKNKSLFGALSAINTIGTCLQYFFFLLYFYCRWNYQK